MEDHDNNVAVTGPDKDCAVHYCNVEAEAFAGPRCSYEYHRDYDFAQVSIRLKTATKRINHARPLMWIYTVPRT